MSETLKMSDDGQLRVRLVADVACDNPREMTAPSDQIVHAVTVPDSNYLDVAGSRGPLAEGWDRIKDENPDAVEVFERWARIFHGAVTLYESPSTGSTRVWYMLPAQFGEVSDPAAVLKGEAQEYRAWADGEVYGYVIERLVKWNRQDGTGEMTTWEGVEDGFLWGLIGYKYACETALSALDDYTGTGS